MTVSQHSPAVFDKLLGPEYCYALIRRLYTELSVVTATKPSSFKARRIERLKKLVH